MPRTRTFHHRPSTSMVNTETSTSLWPVIVVVSLVLTSMVGWCLYYVVKDKLRKRRQSATSSDDGQRRTISSIEISMQSVECDRNEDVASYVNRVIVELNDQQRHLQSKTDFMRSMSTQAMVHHPPNSPPSTTNLTVTFSKGSGSRSASPRLTRHDSHRFQPHQLERMSSQCGACEKRVHRTPALTSSMLITKADKV